MKPSQWRCSHCYSIDIIAAAIFTDDDSIPDKIWNGVTWTNWDGETEFYHCFGCGKLMEPIELREL